MRSLHALAATAVIAVVLACNQSEQPQAAKPAAKASTDTHKVHAVAAGTCDNLTPPTGSQFPAGFDYPQSPSTVASWITNRLGDRQRLHAYCVFAGLNQPSSGATVWRTWATATQAFPWEYNPWQGAGAGATASAARPITINQARSHALGKVGAILNPPPLYPIADAVANMYPQCRQQLYDNENPPQPIPNKYILRDGNVFQSNGDIMVAAVSYNNPAISNIIGKQMYDAAVLSGQLPSSPTSPAKTIQTPMPSSSIVLKVMLWPVSGGGTTWTAVTALPVWDWSKNPPGSSSDNQYAGYEMQKFWTRAAAISSGPVSGPSRTQRVQFLYGVLGANATPSNLTPLGPNTYDSGQVVGLDRFYSKKFTDAEFKALSACDHAILDASAYWAYKRSFQIQDSLVLVAMHIMTKEPQSDWTFQSAWWNPDAQACTTGDTRFCGGRPASVPGGDTTWQNYMMTTTYGMLQKPDKTNHPNFYAPSDTKLPPQVWPVAYNPYIELAASHPITTNCMNCHHRAAWPPDTSQKPVGNYPQSAYLQQSPANPNALETYTWTNAIFNGQVTVDSMWAVSDRAGYGGGAAPKK